MGRIFREKDQIEIEGWTVVRSQKFVTRPDGKGARSIKTYHFTHQATQIPGSATDKPPSSRKPSLGLLSLCVALDDFPPPPSPP